MRLRTLIIDDEAHIRRSLSAMLAVECPNVDIVGTADGVESGLQAIEKHHPDLLLLDIKMADGTGFDLLRRAGPVNFRIIFVTAYEEFAIKAFRFSAIDYLLKPVNGEDLRDAVDKALRSMDTDFTAHLKALEENLSNRDPMEKKIVLRTNEAVWLVKTKEISYCEADMGYTRFFLMNGKAILVSGNLMEFEDILRDSGFFRAHKSFLVNLSDIVRFEKGDGGFLVMSNNDRVPVASRKRDELLELFKKLTG
ncbi:MAG: LytTR family DNA-binding domain-containing protein [Bacteroidales bacterium]|nr:LytTR family DNA-binding domain-containing protein [Bacteroidales bacterium]